MKQELRIQVLADEDPVLVHVEGEIDLRNGRQLREALKEAIAAAGTSVRIDLSGVSYCGSEGVNAIVRASHEATGRSVDLRVTAASPPVERVLMVTGLDYLLGGAAATPEPN